MSPRDPFVGLMAFLGTFMVLALGVYPVIGEWIVLHDYYSPEQIERDDIRVVEIVRKQEIGFSNGDRVPYESQTKLKCVAVLGGLTFAYALVAIWLLHRLRSGLVSPARRSIPGLPGRL
jgi:hypothetical protein